MVRIGVVNSYIWRKIVSLSCVVDSLSGRAPARQAVGAGSSPARRKLLIQFFLRIFSLKMFFLINDLVDFFLYLTMRVL